MRNIRRFRNTALPIVCLAFTGGGVAWADDTPATPDFYIEDPYAPHKTVGSEARIGSSVGFLYHEPVDVTAVGGSAAMGYRFGRFTVEAEYTYLAFQVRGPVGRRLLRPRPRRTHAEAASRGNRNPNDQTPLRAKGSRGPSAPTDRTRTPGHAPGPP